MNCTTTDPAPEVAEELDRLRKEVSRLGAENEKLRGRQAEPAESDDPVERYHLLQAIIDATDDLIFVKDTRFVYLAGNKAFETFIGRPLDQIVGHRDDEWFPDQETVDYFRDWDRVLFSSGEVQDIQEWVDYPDGRRVLLHTIKYPIFDGQEVIGLVGVSRDITQLNKTQTALAEKESYQRALLENFPFVVWMKDTEGKFLTTNQRGLRQAGLNRLEDLVGKTNADLWSKELTESMTARIGRSWKTDARCL